MSARMSIGAECQCPDYAGKHVHLARYFQAVERLPTGARYREHNAVWRSIFGETA